MMFFFFSFFRKKKTKIFYQRKNHFSLKFKMNRIFSLRNFSLLQMATKSKRTIETNSLRRDIEKCTSERLHGCFETKTGLSALIEYKHWRLFDRQANAEGAHNIRTAQHLHNTHTRIEYMPGPERQTTPMSRHMCTYHFYWTKPETRSHARTHTMVRYIGSVENSCIYWMRNEDTKPTTNTLTHPYNIISIEYEVVTAKYFPVVFFLLRFIICSFFVCNAQTLNVESLVTEIYTYTYRHMAHQLFIEIVIVFVPLRIEYWYNTNTIYAEWVSINALDSGNCVNCLLRLSHFNDNSLSNQINKFIDGKL